MTEDQYKKTLAAFGTAMADYEKKDRKEYLDAFMVGSAFTHILLRRIDRGDTDAEIAYWLWRKVSELGAEIGPFNKPEDN